MKILDAKIKWMLGWINNPRLYLLVDRVPLLKEYKFKYKNCLYYAELDGAVRFYYYFKSDEGFGGRHFNIIMENGQEKTLEGPWSSRAGCANKLGFGPCMDIAFTDEKEVWNRGYTFFTGAITLELAEQALKIIRCKIDHPLYFIKKILANSIDNKTDVNQEETSSNNNIIYFPYNKKLENIEWTIIPSLDASVLEKPSFPRNYNVIRDPILSQDWSP